MKQFLETFISSSLGGRVLRGAAAGIITRLMTMAASLLLSIVLARILGVNEYGIYAFVFALVGFFGLPIHLGLPLLVTRETAQANANNDSAKIRAIESWAIKLVLLSSIAMSILLISALFISSSWMSPERFSTLLWGTLLIPLIALAGVKGSAILGLRHVTLSAMSDKLSRPIILVIFILALNVFKNNGVSAASAMALHCLATFMMFIIGGYILSRLNSPTPNLITFKVSKDSNWLLAILPLTIISGQQLILSYIDLIMLGLMRNDAEVGFYRIALSWSTLCIFGITALGSALSPYLARLHAKSDKERLQKLISFSALACLVFALPTVFLFVFCGEFILQVFYGNEFTIALSSLVILSLSQLINAFFGLVGVLLAMSGNERECLKGLMFSALINVIFNGILIPLYGFNGAAIATGISILIWNLFFWSKAKQILGIDSTIIYFLRTKFAQAQPPKN